MEAEAGEGWGVGMKAAAEVAARECAGWKQEKCPASRLPFVNPYEIHVRGMKRRAYGHVDMVRHDEDVGY